MNATQPLITLPDVEAAIPPALRGVRPNRDQGIPGEAGLVVMKGWRCAYLQSINQLGVLVRFDENQLAKIRTSLLLELEGVVRKRLAGSAPEAIEAAVRGLKRVLSELGPSSETERRVQDMGGVLRGLLVNKRTRFLESLDDSRPIPKPETLSAGGTGTQNRPPKAITWIDELPPLNDGDPPSWVRHIRFDEAALRDKTRPDVVQLSYRVTEAEFNELELLRASGVTPPPPLFKRLSGSVKLASDVVVRVIDNNAPVSGLGHYEGTLEYLEKVLRDVTTSGKSRFQLGLTFTTVRPDGSVDPVMVKAVVADAYLDPSAAQISEAGASKAARKQVSLVKTRWRLDASLKPIPGVGGELFETIAPALLKADVQKLAARFAERLKKVVKTAS